MRIIRMEEMPPEKAPEAGFGDFLKLKYLGNLEG